uniref:Palmitoyltransferase n=1 Tax=Rhabditophanes sp. KR3021 TaxID=114890 RepID=A0AC35TZZ2_9BILA
MKLLTIEDTNSRLPFMPFSRPASSTNTQSEIDVRTNDGAVISGTSITKKWQHHKGRNRFFCDGRIFMSQEISLLCLTLFLIIVVMGLYFGFDAPFIGSEVSWAIPVVVAILFLVVLGTLLKTSFSDPGILPRATALEVAEFDRQCEEAGLGRSNKPVKSITIKGLNFKLKYCNTCRIYRPPRTSHCSICDNCIMSFDHHCPFVGNCVGQRNYRYFYFFIVSLTILNLLVMGSSVAHLVMLAKEKSSFVDCIKESPVSVFIFAACFLSIWSIIGLAGFHTYLLATAQTTNEDIKGTFNTKLRPTAQNPFSRGNIFANFYAVLCGPEPLSLLDARGIYNPYPNVRVKLADLPVFLPTVNGTLQDAESQHIHQTPISTNQVYSTTASANSSRNQFERNTSRASNGRYFDNGKIHNSANENNFDRHGPVEFRV